MAYGILSGIEIAEAVERQRRYARAGYRVDRTGSPIAAVVRWWLRRKPRIHIDGFDPTPSDRGGALNPNSYNLTLSDELLVYVEDKERLVRTDGLVELDARRNNPTVTMKIPPEGIVLEPGRLYLGRTEQYTGSWNVRPCLNGRSSIGRLGICVHVTAGYGDVGFEGTWTLELTVVHPVRVYAGMGICQIDYATVSPRHRPYLSMKYQGQRGVRASRLHWENE